MRCRLLGVTGEWGRVDWVINGLMGIPAASALPLMGVPAVNALSLIFEGLERSVGDWLVAARRDDRSTAQPVAATVK